MQTTFATPLPLTVPCNPARDALAARVNALYDAYLAALRQSYMARCQRRDHEPFGLELFERRPPLAIDDLDDWELSLQHTQWFQRNRAHEDPAQWTVNLCQELEFSRIELSMIQGEITNLLDWALELDGYIPRSSIRDGANAAAQLFRYLMRRLTDHNSLFFARVPAERTRLAKWIATMTTEVEKLERIR